jgi:hypothetical protein
MDQSAREFVVLRHVLADGEHWDLLLDRGDALATWQLLDDPADLAPRGPLRSLRARPIGDHRRAYLTYEGPVSGGRGHVTRVDRGTHAVLEQHADAWALRLSGARLAGRFNLRRVGPPADAWELQRIDT